MYRIVLIVLLLHLMTTANGQVQNRISSAPECISTLHINKFRCIDRGNASKKNKKIVVGRDIDYKSKGGSGSNYNWKIGSGTCSTNNNFWNLQRSVTPITGFSKKGKKAIIPNTSLPINNSDFGDTHGLVKVSDGLVESCTDKNGNDFIVEVFFEKDAITNPSGTVPNWFYYWSKISQIQNLLTIPGIPIYDINTCSYSTSPVPVTLLIEYDGIQFPYNANGYSTYGGNSFSMYYGVSHHQINQFLCNTSSQTVGVGYDQSKCKIIIGEGCGHKKATDTCNPIASHEGIHTFYTTLIHEVEHAIIECDVWNFTHSSDPSVQAGFSSLWDLDHDGYKDIWEINSAEGTSYQFSFNPLNPNMNDAYNPQYNYDPSKPNSCDYCMNSSGPVCSAGTRYEEDRCRAKEKSVNKNIVNYADWSFDPTNISQGKNWK